MTADEPLAKPEAPGNDAEAMRSRLLALSEELRLARDEARLANAAKSNFLAIMSHELRTPLNAIIGFADIIKKELFGPLGDAKYREYILDIEQNAEHLLSLVNDILDLSKIEAGRLELDEDDVDICESVEACLRLVREHAMSGRVALAVDMPADLPRLVADRRAIRQVLLNLLSNAVKFTAEGGSVTVSARLASGQGMILTVADTGIGIAEADIETAMAPFGQVDSSHARKAEGTGLGLPLVKQLVELHGGTLELESQPGAGTEVRVILPSERVIAGYGLAGEA